MMLHPIVQQLSPSEEQTPAILARGQEVVVTAGAGTGKTRTLVARYLALLSEGTGLRSIVAITFTQKAAREMRNRLRDAIRGYLDRADLSGDERDLWQAHYSTLDAARVSTIHSLCTEILRAHPAEAGLDPRFEVLEEGLTNVLREQAITESLTWAANQPEVVSLFGLLGEAGLRRTLAVLLNQRLETSAIFATMPDNLIDHWQQKLSQAQARVQAELTSSTAWQANIEALRHNEPTNATDKLEAHRQTALAVAANPAGLLADLDTIKLNVGSQKNWPGGAEQVAEVKAALRTIRELWQKEKDFLLLALNDLDEAAADALPRLRRLFQYGHDRFVALKEAQNSLDFDDLEDKTLRLLRDHETVRQRWQRDIQAILIDEFQDTNGHQRDLLALLNGDQGKLFIVGDAKQSIYRFRGADVSVFRAERDEIVARGGRHVPLEMSYRAHRALIEGMNDLLAPVLGRAADPSRPWLGPFSALKPHRQVAGQGFAAPHIELHLTVGSKNAGALERAATALVSRLIELVEGEEIYAGVGDKVRRLDYGHVAILCRASTAFAPYEDALEAAGVPFLTVAGRGFYERPEIRDLLNALQAIADPTDNLALVGLLRSPAFSFSDEGLYRLRQAQTQTPNSLWEALTSSALHLSETDQLRLDRARPIIDRLYRQVGRTPIADILKQFLDETHYRAALIQIGQQRSARNVSKLLADANAAEFVSVNEFLAYINNLRDSGSREGEARTTAEGAVQLMTIHAAKGLEFPVIALGDISYRPPSRQEILTDPELGLLIPHKKDEEKNIAAGYRLGRRKDAEQEEAEFKRLLYVAVTRAEEKVLLSGAISLNKANKLQRVSGWLAMLAETNNLGLGELTIEHDETGDKAVELTLSTGQSPVRCTIYEPGYSATQSGRIATIEPETMASIPPPLLEPVAVSKAPLTIERLPRIARVVSPAVRQRAPAWVVGDLTHKALATWRFGEDGFEVWLAAQARNYGLTDDEQVTDAVQKAQRMLKRFQSHELYHRMNSAERCLHEVPYSLVVDGTVESGRMDALFLQDGAWHVVEFKTDTVRDEAERDRVLAQTDYLVQVQRYRQVIDTMLKQEAQIIFCWLNYAGRVEVQTDLLEKQGNYSAAPY